MSSNSDVFKYSTCTFNQDDVEVVALKQTHTGKEFNEKYSDNKLKKLTKVSDENYVSGLNTMDVNINTSDDYCLFEENVHVCGMLSYQTMQM